MAEPWTIRRVIQWSAEDFATRELDSPRLDAELLVAHALGVDRVRLYLQLDQPLNPVELGAIRDLVKRRRAHEPIAYILGRREYWGRSFDVDRNVLVPRPDTETLTERALELLPPESDASAIDLCTGSGCIAVTLAAERPNVLVTATDLSPSALDVARRNAHKHGVGDRMRFASGDLFAACSEIERFDLITCNPPYVAESERDSLAPDLRYEPELALFAGPDGTDVLRRFLAEVPNWLAENGTLLMEIGADQGAIALGLARQAGLEASILQDLAKRDRVVEARLERRAQDVSRR